MDTLMDLKCILQQLPSNSHGFWIPREDRFQGEYIHPYDERLAHITGFSGSAGLAIVYGFTWDETFGWPRDGCC